MKERWKRICVWSSREASLRALLFIVIALRLATLGFPALTDPSEARYATVSQRMVQTGQWLIPEINRGGGFEPFWGKPPLHFWLTAASFKLFGFNEWAARLPSFLGALLVVALLFQFAAAFHSRMSGYLSALIAFSSFTFLSMSGASMTDMTLTCCTTGAAVAFALACAREKPDRGWGVVFFLSLALGMITKGPIAIAFPGGAIFLWLAAAKRFGALTRLPWITGIIVFLAVAVPWFVFAEEASPGLNKYFFLNENLLRFISRNYQDRYGSGHPIFRGAIWLFLFAGLLPWSAYLAARGRAFLSFVRSAWAARFGGGIELYILLWALLPICFFTVARSVIFTYVLPSLPAFALLIGWFALGPEDGRPERAGKFGAASAAVSIIILSIIISASQIINSKMSSKILIRALQSRNATSVTFDGKLPYSALFYGNDGYGAPVAVSFVPKGEERSVPCGILAVGKRSADEVRAALSIKKSTAVNGWELLELEPCSAPR